MSVVNSPKRITVPQIKAHKGRERKSEVPPPPGLRLEEGQRVARVGSAHHCHDDRPQREQG